MLVPTPHIRDIIMLERISFQLANNRGRYTHFVHDDGTVASLYPLETICEARVGLICEKEFPSEAQYDAAEELASFAVGINPHIIVTFDEGTSPFRPTIRQMHCWRRNRKAAL